VKLKNKIYQFHKLSQIKQKKLIKRTWTKYEEIINWRVAFKFYRVNVEINGERWKKKERSVWAIWKTQRMVEGRPRQIKCHLINNCMTTIRHLIRRPKTTKIIHMARASHVLICILNQLLKSSSTNFIITKKPIWKNTKLLDLSYKNFAFKVKWVISLFKK
jgi:hypothetical protein